MGELTVRALPGRSSVTLVTRMPCTETTHSGDAQPTTPGEGSDEMLLAAIGRGDPNALGLLYDRYNRLSIAVAYRVLGDRNAAEDTVQDAFLSVWRRVDSFDSDRGSARGWLLTIVRNAAVDRRRGRHARALQDAPLDDVTFRLATDGEETFAAVAASVEASRVRDALALLPSEQREAIEMAYFGGLTHQEIADRTGTALGTVKGRMRLGLHKLRAALADMLPPDASIPVPPQSEAPSHETIRAARAPSQPIAIRWSTAACVVPPIPALAG
jgi:RNA polymerase sigma-70 factor (ECF subfamily)